MDEQDLPEDVVLKVPHPSEVLAQAEIAKADGRSVIRFLVPPTVRFMNREGVIWDGVRAWTRGYRNSRVSLPGAPPIPAATIVEVAANDVIGAAKREDLREGRSA